MNIKRTIIAIVFTLMAMTMAMTTAGCGGGGDGITASVGIEKLEVGPDGLEKVVISGNVMGIPFEIDITKYITNRMGLVDVATPPEKQRTYLAIWITDRLFGGFPDAFKSYAYCEVDIVLNGEPLEGVYGIRGVMDLLGDITVLKFFLVVTDMMGDNPNDIGYVEGYC